MLGEQVSHYRLDEKLGEGTYGAVYRGVHVHSEQLQVAVKVVHPALLSEQSFVEALQSECLSLDQMDHRHIVRFRELVISEGLVAMVLELLKGCDLHEKCQRGKLSIQDAIDLIEPALDGLAYAHDKGIIHRDIKPSNIYLCNDGRVKLLDFGIARAAQNTQATRTGTLKGTLDYMAPERFGAEGGGTYSDIYAMGLVAWELIAGRPACPDGDLPSKMGWHFGVQAPDLRNLRTDCPAWLAEWVVSLIDKDKTSRPQNGAAALASLRQMREAGEPVRTAPQQVRAAAPRTVNIQKIPLSEATPPAPMAAPTPGGNQPPGTVQLTKPAPAPPADSLPPAAAAPTPTVTAQTPAPTPAPTPAGNQPPGTVKRIKPASVPAPPADSLPPAASAPTPTETAQAPAPTPAEAPAAQSHCFLCAEAIGPEDHFCMHCGIRLHKAGVTAPCSQCGEAMSPGDQFCTSCGHTQAGAAGGE
jgi:serine/threonine-protein kinase